MMKATERNGKMNPKLAKAFLRGVIASLPFLLVVVPFAMIFGVASAAAGLNVLQTVVFSVSVFAGASQFAALQLMQEQAPTLIVLATALTVNLRMVMYSVAMTPHLGAAPLGMRMVLAYFLIDQSFAAAQVEYEKRPDQSVMEKSVFFLGSVFLVAPLWMVATVAGALLGTSLPEEYALDFAVPITFLAITAPMLRSLPHIVAAFVSITGALLFNGLPFGTGLLLAAALAMAAGAGLDHWQERRK